MLISRISMENFRGFQDKMIEFHDNPVVLISAANGIGKTTIVDAIEWCLTGNIGRLKNAFDTRSTNDTDRKLNTDGILKNRYAEPDDYTKVTIWLLNENQEICLCREQKKDELNPKLSRVTINENETEAKAFIKDYVGDSFYNFHFCDIQKSFNVQSKKRKELKDIFDEFITNYDNQKQIAANLELFADDVERYIDDKRIEKISQDVIDNNVQLLEKARVEAKQITYPGVSFYSEEKLDIVNLNKDELIVQKQEIKNCGYKVAEDSLSRLVANEEKKRQKAVVERIYAFWETKEEVIQSALESNLMNDSKAITVLEQRLASISELSLLDKTIIKDGEVIVELKNVGFTQEDFEKDKLAIESKTERVDILTKDIELLTKNNAMLKVLSSLSANKHTILEYRETMLKKNGKVNCPVCGSGVFSTLEEAQILKETEEYIKQNGDTVKEKEEDIIRLQKEITTCFHGIIERAKTVIKEEMGKLDSEISILRQIQTEITPYLTDVKELQKMKTGIKVHELTKEMVNELRMSINTLTDSEVQMEENIYQRILTVLGYQFENETVQQTYEKVKNFSANVSKPTSFSYDTFVSKLNAIDSILANQKLAELTQKMETDLKKNNEIDIEIAKLEKLKDNATNRAEEIKSIIENLSKDEYKKIGPSLSKFYNKLIRFNSREGINIIPEDEGISLVDDNDKNIVNVLSNGQISVFMLAHFFAGINARNDYEKMKIYFIDDLTACMDDVNMLAFMDLLKYQISAKDTMDQLFFITCDNRISKLFKYKLTGKGFDPCELSEEDFK